jgi:hypothetical protein
MHKKIKTPARNIMAKQPQNSSYPYASLGGLGFGIRQTIYKYTLLVLRQVTSETSSASPSPSAYTETQPAYSDCFILDFQNINCALFRVNKQISQESLQFSTQRITLNILFQTPSTYLQDGDGRNYRYVFVINLEVLGSGMVFDS